MCIKLFFYCNRLKFFSTDFGQHEPDPYGDFDHIIVFFDWGPKLKFIINHYI